MKMRAMKKGLLALVIMGCTSVVAHAHDDAYFDAHPAPHGGQMRMAGPYHMELVTGQDALTVYVTDHGGVQQSTAGWSATAVIMAGAQKSYIELQPAGENVLAGKGNVATGPDTKIVLSVKTQADATTVVRFAPKINQAAHHTGHH